MFWCFIFQFKASDIELVVTVIEAKDLKLSCGSGWRHILMPVYNRKQTTLPRLITSIIIYLFIYLLDSFECHLHNDQWPTLHIEFIEFTLIVWHIQFNPHHMIINGGTKAGIQPLLRRFPSSNVSSLIHSVWRKWGCQVTKHLLQPHGWTTAWWWLLHCMVVDLMLVKCHLWLFLYNGGKCRTL